MFPTKNTAATASVATVLTRALFITMCNLILCMNVEQILRFYFYYKITSKYFFMICKKSTVKLFLKKNSINTYRNLPNHLTTNILPNYMFYQICIRIYIHIQVYVYFLKKHSLLMFLTKFYTEICFFRYTNTTKFNKDISLWNLLIYMVISRKNFFFVYEISVVVLSRCWGTAVHVRFHMFLRLDARLYVRV